VRFIRERVLVDMEAEPLEVAPADPPTSIAVTTLLGSVALAAALFPARRAATVDPIAALRRE
jgi:ABC-type lipoprotein release transport system permease subunit